MTTPQENPALTAELQRLAQSYVETAAQTFGLTLDYSEASLRQTDEAITKFQSGSNALEETLLPYGAYVGETLRRRLGGVWVQDERGVALLDGIGGLDLKASPFSWAQNRLANGMADALAARFEALKQQVLQTGSATPATGPSAEENTIITRSPLLIFLLVAAADGKVDRKELAGFEKVISSVMIGATPRLRQAMSDMLPEMEQHLEALSEINPVDELKRLAAVLDTCCPKEAEAFKRELMGIAVKIAESSGGFLGFGSKVSDEEKAAIAGIGITLGLIKPD